jgi:hypothetical protein
MKGEEGKNHYNHCNINGNTKYKCFQDTSELNPKDFKKYAKKENMLALDSGTR